ncbi:hypothetical protein SMACR_00557 [Sordaria macrospora]|uniref:Uncharacterized protein n=1 Tax=Sordaria macrospora TaxID=5147 RepID=A0A8S9A5M3_SORMA|nr:hypothetical protein SMACR_00557 [Sordaria macrospora]WPJ59308.1 hypothetical protein SMAC4_00557 [Sordaria macrospora]
MSSTSPSSSSSSPFSSSSSSSSSSTRQQPLVLAATASTIAEKARSTSQLIEKTLLPPPASFSNTDSKPDPSNPYPSNPSLKTLNNLAAKLLQFNQHANTLGDCITSASSSGVADVLAKALDHALTRCEQGVEIMKGQVELVRGDGDVLELDPAGETGTPTGEQQNGGVEANAEKGSKKRDVDGQVVEEYVNLLIAYSRVFIFFSQIVIVNEEEQAEWMARNEVGKILALADEAADKVLAGKSIVTQ